MRNNNNNVYKLKYVACVEFYVKTIGIKKEVYKNYKGYSSYCCCLKVMLGLFS